MLNINEELANKVAKGFQIPSQPRLLLEIQDVLNSKSINTVSLASEISKDIGLSAYVLKLVNAPVFGMHRMVSDISQAVLVLGLKNLHDIVLIHSIKTAWDPARSSISLERFWDECSEIALIATLAVEELDLKSICPKEYAYTLGLFHDCGIAAMAQKFPDYKNTLATINQSQSTSFTQLEDETYQTNHATVGYFITRAWNLPAQLCEFVGRHHELDYISDQNVDDSHRYLALCLKLSDQVLSIHKRNQNDPEWDLYIPVICEYFGLSTEDLNTLVENLVKEYSMQSVLF